MPKRENDILLAANNTVFPVLAMMCSGNQHGRIFAHAKRRDSDMPPLDEQILRIFGEASEGLFASDIAERLNEELRPNSAYKSVDVANYVKGMGNLIAQSPDGRWMLKRLTL